MKKLIITLLLGLLTVPLFAQWNPLVDCESPYLNVTYNNTDKDTIYILFPDDQNNYYISETLPTQYFSGSRQRRHKHTISGDLYLCYEPNKTSGAFDSLAHWIHPIIWEPLDKEYTVVDKDSTFLVFDTADTYTASSADYHDMTDAAPVGCLLTSELWSVAGFALIGRQADEGTGVSVVTYWYSFLREWR